MGSLILVGVLFLQEVAGASGDNGLRLESALAFGGHVGSRGGFTEVAVRAYAGTPGGVAEVHPGDTEPPVIAVLDMRAGESVAFRMPLYLGSGDAPASLHVRLFNGSAQSQPLEITRHRRPLTVLVGTRAQALLERFPDAVAASSATLPEYQAAWHQVGSLAIDGDALGELSDRQLGALLQYAGNCGRLLLIDAGDRTEQVFMQRNPCGAVISNAEGADVGDLFDALKARQPALPASSAQLGRLALNVDANNPFAGQLPLFWIAFLVVFGLLAAHPRTRLAGLAFCGIATGLVFLAWPTAPARTYVAWAESHMNGGNATYGSLEQFVAARASRHEVSTGRFGGVPTGIVGTNYGIIWNVEDQGALVAWDATPFQRLELEGRGYFPVETQLVAARVGDEVTVCNEAQKDSGVAWLDVDGDIYRVLPLSPGESWSTADHDPLTGPDRRRPELRMLRDRAMNYPLAWVQSLPISGGTAADHAWLMRYAIQPQEASCRG